MFHLYTTRNIFFFFATCMHMCYIQALFAPLKPLFVYSSNIIKPKKSTQKLFKVLYPRNRLAKGFHPQFCFRSLIQLWEVANMGDSSKSGVLVPTFYDFTIISSVALKLVCHMNYLTFMACHVVASMPCHFLQLHVE